MLYAKMNPRIRGRLNSAILDTEACKKAFTRSDGTQILKSNRSTLFEMMHTQFRKKTIRVLTGEKTYAPNMLNAFIATAEAGREMIEKGVVKYDPESFVRLETIDFVKEQLK